MDFLTPIRVGIWAALYSAALAIAFTAPVRALPGVLAAAFLGRFSRDILMQSGLSIPMATLIAAFLATGLGVKAARDVAFVPVATITALLPLAPTPILFDTIHATFKLFAQDKAVAAAAATDFTTNSVKALGVLGAMALGTAIPLLVTRGDWYPVTTDQVRSDGK
jgi:uncharacterized membrane protein YjjB (DUF3815 family)